MSAHRFFVEGDLGWREGLEVDVALSADDLHHASHVLRLQPGETIEVAPAAGGTAFQVELTSVAAERIAGRVVAVLPARDATATVVLVQGVAKGDKMDSIVRQAVEVGVGAVAPVLTERSVVRLDAGKRAAKAERWSRIAKSAAEQSHRSSVPPVYPPVTLAEFAKRTSEFERIVVLWEDADAASAGSRHLDAVVAAWPNPQLGKVALVVGPEGGLSVAEVEALVQAGAEVATLGTTVLRTETAAVVGTALLIHELRRAGATP